MRSQAPDPLHYPAHQAGSAQAKPGTALLRQTLCSRVSFSLSSPDPQLPQTDTPQGMQGSIMGPHVPQLYHLSNGTPKKSMERGSKGRMQL